MMKIRRCDVRALLLAGTLAMLASSVAAQTRETWNTTGLQLTRTELEELLQRYEETAESGSYSRSLREQARAEAELLRARLTEGDLRIGDRVLLVVEGQQQLSDTFNVVAGRKLVLPEIGEVDVAGVLRSELQEHMSRAIGRFIRNPSVRARSLIRVEIMGAIGRPGFYMLPSDMLISDALMEAGGPSGDARLDRARVERSGEVIWSGDRLREAIVEGRTLDQLSLRAGDTVIVPAASSRFGWLREASMVLSGVTALVLLALQVF